MFSRLSPRVIRFERFSWRFASGAGERLAVAVMAVFLLFSPYLANVSRDYTRLCYFWTVRDSFELILILSTAALLLAAVGELIHHAGISWMSRVHRLLLLALLGAGVMANVVFIGQKVPHLRWLVSVVQGSVGWLALAVFAVHAALSRRSRVVARTRVLCKVFIPVVPITFAGLLWQATYPAPLEPVTYPSPVAATTDVNAARLTGGTTPSGGIYLFLFDEWSYERTFRNGAALERYPNLAAFAASATVYHDAHAPGTKTEQSIPAMLYQTDLPVRIHQGRFGFAGDGGFVPIDELQSVFARLQPLGYREAVVGFSLPYRLWLGDHVDLCRSYCYYLHGTDTSSRIAQHLTNVWYYSPETWTSRMRKRYEKRAVHDLIISIIADAHRDVHAIIRNWPDRTFLFAHLHLPHPPAVVHADLAPRAAWQTIWADESVAGYENNLAAMDVMLGELVQALRDTGKFDDSVVVLTADHNWRSDPDLTQEEKAQRLSHVPLLVKSPGQTDRRSVTRRFETCRLGELIESIVQP